MIQEFGERLNSSKRPCEGFQDEVQSATNTATSASDKVDELSGEVESVEGQLDDLEDDIEAVREEIDDGKLADRINETESEIEESRTVARKLSSVIGGGDNRTRLPVRRLCLHNDDDESGRPAQGPAPEACWSDSPT